MRAQNGELKVLLTPTKYVPRHWLGDLNDKKILELASGGAQQMPVFCAHGAAVTVLDYSEKQLESERMVARREGYALEIVKADMTERLPFEDQCFDLIFHPVSNCYVEDVRGIWRECYRILKPGGALLAGFDNGVQFLVDEDLIAPDQPLYVTNRLPFNPLKDPKLLEQLRQSDSGVQFSHSLEEQIGGQLQAGFTLQDLYEDTDPNCRIGRYCSMYIATKAVKL